MPLPDATKDKRIYQLLKNIDLGNLTFSEFQTAAQSVFAEPEAEDTLRRIVLVNLARMSVAGDWAGLTTAGGGGAFGLELLPPTFNGGMEYSLPALTPPSTNDTFSTQYNATGTYFYPFVCSNSGALASMSIYVATVGGCTTGTFDIAIYSDTDGVPTDLLGFAQFSCNSTGTIIDSSLSATITLERGTQYWVAFFRNGLNGNPYIYAAKYDSGGSTGIYGSVFQQNSPTIVTTASTFPATVTASDLGSAGGVSKVNVGLKW